MEQLIFLLEKYGYFILLPIAVIEGPIITVIGAFLASLGFLNVFIVYGVVVAGDLVGDIIFYAIGRWGGRTFLEKWGKYFGISLDDVSHLESHFEKQGGKTILFGKWTHFVGIAVLVAAGIAKTPFRRFLLINFLGSLPKSLAFLIIGYYFGQAYRQINEYFGYATLSIFFVVIVSAAIYFFVKKFKKSFTHKSDA